MQRESAPISLVGVLSRQVLFRPVNFMIQKKKCEWWFVLAIEVARVWSKFAIRECYDASYKTGWHPATETKTKTWKVACCQCLFKKLAARLLSPRLFINILAIHDYKLINEEFISLLQQWILQFWWWEVIMWVSEQIKDQHRNSGRDGRDARSFRYDR